jgi:hypothetical protein
MIGVEPEAGSLQNSDGETTVSKDAKSNKSFCRQFHIRVNDCALAECEFITICEARK